MKYFILYLAAMNVVSFFAMFSDKQKAKKHKWRTPEKVLFLFVILGGGIGGTAGMYAFHHKTKHWYFKYGFPFITILEYVALIYLIMKNIQISLPL